MNHRTCPFGIRLMTLILGFVAFAPGNAAEPKRSQTNWDNLKELRAGQKIEVVDSSLKTLKGTFISVSDADISLRAGKSEESVSRANVVRVSVRDTSHRTRNMLLGAAIGGGIAIAATIVPLAANSNEGNGCGVCIAGIAAGFGAGTALGAIPGNRTVYRVKR